MHQKVAINGRDIINTRNKVKMAQNGKYLTDPKIYCGQTWNFCRILSIFDFKCKIMKHATGQGQVGWSLLVTCVCFYLMWLNGSYMGLWDIELGIYVWDLSRCDVRG